MLYDIANTYYYYISKGNWFYGKGDQLPMLAFPKLLCTHQLSYVFLKLSFLTCCEGLRSSRQERSQERLSQQRRSLCVNKTYIEVSASPSCPAQLLYMEAKMPELARSTVGVTYTFATPNREVLVNTAWHITHFINTPPHSLWIYDNRAYDRNTCTQGISSSQIIRNSIYVNVYIKS